MLEGVCLSCTLPICDDQSKQCAFVKITVGETDRERVARIYRADPQKKIDQVRAWQKANKERLNAYQRERYARLKGKECQTNQSHG